MQANKPGWPQVAVPTLHEVVARHAAERPTAIALRFRDQTISYAELDQSAARLAARLTRHGLQEDDRIAFVGRNSDALPVIALAANRIGVVPVPINWRLAPSEVEAQIVDAEASIVFVEPEFEAMVCRLQRRVAAGFDIVPARDAVSGAWSEDVPIGASRVDDPRCVAVQIYTSGTTGQPKGVMLSHRSLNGINILRGAHVPWDSWGSSDVTLVSAPLGHIGAYGMMARALFFGGEVVVQEAFEPGAVLDAIERHGVSKIALVPTAIKMLLDHPHVRQIDYSRIDTIIYGASPITLTLLRDAMDVFGCQFAQSYGQTETSGPVVALPPADHDTTGNGRMASAGRALPASEVRIVDSDGRTLGVGEDGEICIRSIAVMEGYWRRPEETARVLSADGWLRTGDAGHLDADGYLFVRARVKDMIISGAENIYPAEVENVLAAHPDVAEVAVIGVPDVHWGEAVKAFVVARTGCEIVTETLRDWARERVAGYKLPKTIDVVAALPYNATGKVDKRVLRAPYWRDADRAVH